MFDQQRDRLPPMDEGDLLLWMRHAGALQGSEGRGEELETVARGQLEPAAHGQQSPWAQVPHVHLECLHRIKKTLVEGVDTGCRGTEGVQQGDLNQIIVIPTGRHEAAGFADMQTYIRGAVEMAGKIGVYPLHQVDDLRVEFNRVNGAGLMIARLQHVHAPAGSEDEHAGTL